MRDAHPSMPYHNAHSGCPINGFATRPIPIRRRPPRSKSSCNTSPMAEHNTMIATRTGCLHSSSASSASSPTEPQAQGCRLNFWFQSSNPVAIARDLPKRPFRPKAGGASIRCGNRRRRQAEGGAAVRVHPLRRAAQRSPYADHPPVRRCRFRDNHALFPLFRHRRDMCRSHLDRAAKEFGSERARLDVRAVCGWIFR